ncbi:MAG: hypothetical protein ABI398_10990 [Devosia sp.]
MRASIVIKIAIERPYAEVYEFLANPMNFAKWAANPDSDMVPLDGGNWLVELPRGQSVIRFSPHNNFGVLDYEVFALGETHGPISPVRLIANADCCELVLIWYHRDGASDERFRSDAQWVESDLTRLKTLLEGG